MGNSSEKSNAKYPVQTLGKALDIIEVLYKEGSSKGLGITEIGNKLGMGKSTVHRNLDTLAAYDYVEKLPDSSKYCLGWRIFEIGSIVPLRRNLYNFDVNILQELCNKQNETINFGIRAKSDVVIISKIEPSNTLMANFQVGGRESIYATSMGKLLISDFSKEEVIEIIGEEKFIKYTPNTITSIDELMGELEIIKKQGYSIDNEEFCLGLFCMAMPVKNYKNEMVAAVSVSGPSSRLNSSRIIEVRKDLEEATLKLSAYFGCKPE